jgi:hypothetical protein
MPKLLRRASGQPIRDAMRVAGLSGPELAATTRQVDPARRGVSAATVGRVAGRGATARDSCELRTAWLIADALDVPLQSLFSMPPHSTSTVERSTPP